MTTELKPCPNMLCDNKDIGLIELVKEHSNNEDIFYYQCVVCGCVHPKEYPTRKEAIAAWNTRPIEDELRARIKELEATIDALLNQNKTQMLELEKHEAWQKEAVPYLNSYLLYGKANAREHDLESIRQLESLIKQADENDNT